MCIVLTFSAAFEDDVVYLNDEPTDSDVGSDSDSNAEDYYANDYPDEEDFGDYNSRYSKSSESSDSDYY